MNVDEAARRLLASPLLRRIARAWPHGAVFLTGGSLRDRLLGRPVHDLDLVVDGDPAAAAAAMARTTGARAFCLGRPPLSVWRVPGRRHQLDVTGLAGGVAEDIRRRDFTINALFWRLPRGPLLDLFGGLDDLAAGCIRLVAERNLADDPLRVLRAVRLLATHPQLSLTAATAAALARHAPALRGVARERIRTELELTVTAPGAERALLHGSRTGALTPLLPAWRDREKAARAAAMASHLGAVAAGRRDALAAAAAHVAPAVLAVPAASARGGWDVDAAADALGAAGWPLRTARTLARTAAAGTRLAPLLGAGGPELRRALADTAAAGAAPVLAWAVAGAREHGRDDLAAARAALAWWRRFAARPPLLSGDEIAALLGLPPGPGRAEAVSLLRSARAAGEVRTASQARRWLERRDVR